METIEPTIEWLRRIIGTELAGHDEIEVSPISLSDGSMGQIHRLETTAGVAVILKRPPGRESPWYGLFVSSSMIDREILAYRLLSELGPATAALAPACRWSQLTIEGPAALVLEHIPQSTPSMTRFCAGLSYEEALATVHVLARLHAAHATTEARTSPLPWLYSADSDELVSAIKMGMDGLPAMMSRFPGCFSGTGLEGLLRLDFRQIVKRSHMSSRLLSICHGDCWSGNVLFQCPEDSGELVAKLIDWQFAMWGNPLSDVALLVVSSLEGDDRRAWTGGLLRSYQAMLTETCALPYSLEACHHDLECAMPFAVLVAAATLDTYTFGLDHHDVARISRRMQTAIDDVSHLFGAH